ncbi:hypothetical protein [Sphingomonas sp. CFBP 13706]|uniref:hypothetical protein n=1 Tax=Sphingomonas sp. CFBP 13706 TaxID=2775314 RepID=UPI001A7EB351|nr:hypothetical protein [Sphingomonas sp. CFBP 13706]
MQAGILVPHGTKERTIAGFAMTVRRTTSSNHADSKNGFAAQAARRYQSQKSLEDAAWIRPPCSVSTAASR